VAVLAPLSLFLLGGTIGHIAPRLPTLIMTRARGFNLHFEAHPLPVRLSPYLTQRVLHLRTFYWLSLSLAVMVMAFGAASLRWGSGPFGFGLWVSSSWLILSRLQGFLAGRPAPWTMAMALELQSVMDAGRSGHRCCPRPCQVWEVQCIRCSECNAVLSRMARPDLGRRRSDGRCIGLLRILISDGYPLGAPLPEEVPPQEQA